MADPAEAPVEQANLADVFGTKKKKRKPKTEKAEGDAKAQEKPEEKADVEEESKEDDKKSMNLDEEDAEGDSSAKDDDKGLENLANEAKEARTKALSDFPAFVERDYTYEELVARLIGMIQKVEEKTTVKIKPPIVYRDGTTKTAWANFPQICQSINRQPDHVLSFVLAEVASTGSLDGSGRLLIRGRFQQKHMEKILRHYIIEYVQCRTCKSLETKLHKENRLLFMNCDSCGSARSVAQIKTGFQATTRASRKTEQNKKT